MRVPLTQADRVYFALAAAGGAAYVYRAALPIGNVSLFRVAILVGGLLLLIRWAQHGVDWVAVKMLPLSAAGVFGPAMDFVRLPEESPHGIELIGYFVNLVGMSVMFSAVAGRAAAMDALKWFCYAVAASIVVAWYAWAMGAIPGEELIRNFGSAYGKELSYLNVDEGVVRLTGPFFDPNFFGAYLVMGIACSQILWAVERRRRWLVLALVCAVSLLLTTSRTALLGLIVLVIVTGEHGLRSSVGRGLALVAALAVAVPIAGAFWDGFYERLLNTDLARLEFLARGWAAFARDPLLGGGASGLEDPDSGLATAHMLYLSAFGRYGLIGGGLLLFFIFAPLFAVLTYRNVDPLSRRLVVGVLLPLAAMYLTYDFYLFLEFQFLLFGIVYAVAFRGIRLGPPKDVAKTHMIVMNNRQSPAR